MEISNQSQQMADVVGPVNAMVSFPDTTDMLIMNDEALLISRDQGVT